MRHLYLYLYLHCGCYGNRQALLWNRIARIQQSTARLGKKTFGRRKTTTSGGITFKIEIAVRFTTQPVRLLGHNHFTQKRITLGIMNVAECLLVGEFQAVGIRDIEPWRK